MNNDGLISPVPPAISSYEAGRANILSPNQAQQNTFSQLLSTMLMANSMNSGAEGSDSSTNMMAPLMMMLMEQLLSSQIQSDPALESASSYAGLSGYADQSAVYGAAGHPAGMPVSGYLTQNYHSSHNGLDIGVPTGTPVKTTMPGKVVYAGWNNEGYGNLVIVENGPYRTYYAHLSSIPVSVGDSVQGGNVIGLSGNTGNSTGPHLHYEIRVNMENIDPSSWTLPYA